MKKLKSHEVEVKLLSLGKSIFTSRDLMVIFGASKRAAEAFIGFNVKKGLFVRLKKGLFALARNFPGDFYLANNFYYPSYVSLDTALSYYGLIPETIYTITSITTKPTREFEVKDRVFVYHKIKKQAFTGFITKKIGEESVYIATPEKGVADFLYFVFLGKREFNERLALEKINKEKLKECLKFFASEKFILFTQNLLEAK